MKKLFLLLLIIPIVFTACGGDDNEEDGDKLEFVQIKVTSEDIKTPNGNVYLYKVNGYSIDSDQPNSWAIEYTPVISYKYNGENTLMLPISSYGTKSKGDLFLSEKDACSVHSIYWYELSSRYGKPVAGDEYLIFIELRNGTYAMASKRFVITKNSLITVKMPTCKDSSKFVDAEWSISDYIGL